VDTNTLKITVCDSPLLTSVVPASTSTCGGKEHCGTVIDDRVSFIEKIDDDKIYLYDINVWSSISKYNKYCK